MHFCQQAVVRPFQQLEECMDKPAQHNICSREEPTDNCCY